jgi:hypothetical protein
VIGAPSIFKLIRKAIEGEKKKTGAHVKNERKANFLPFSRYDRRRTRAFLFGRPKETAVRVKTRGKLIVRSYNHIDSSTGMVPKTDAAGTADLPDVAVEPPMKKTCAEQKQGAHRLLLENVSCTRCN